MDQIDLNLVSLSFDSELGVYCSDLYTIDSVYFYDVMYQNS